MQDEQPKPKHTTSEKYNPQGRKKYDFAGKKKEEVIGTLKRLSEKGMYVSSGEVGSAVYENRPNIKHLIDNEKLTLKAMVGRKKYYDPLQVIDLINEGYGRWEEETFDFLGKEKEFIIEKLKEFSQQGRLVKADEVAGAVYGNDVVSNVSTPIRNGKLKVVKKIGFKRYFDPLQVIKVIRGGKYGQWAREVIDFSKMHLHEIKFKLDELERKEIYLNVTEASLALYGYKNPSGVNRLIDGKNLKCKVSENEEKIFEPSEVRRVLKEGVFGRWRTLSDFKVAKYNFLGKSKEEVVQKLKELRKKGKRLDYISATTAIYGNTNKSNLAFPIQRGKLTQTRGKRGKSSFDPKEIIGIIERGEYGKWRKGKYAKTEEFDAFKEELFPYLRNLTEDLVREVVIEINFREIREAAKEIGYKNGDPSALYRLKRIGELKYKIGKKGKILIPREEVERLKEKHESGRRDRKTKEPEVDRNVVTKDYLKKELGEQRRRLKTLYGKAKGNVSKAVKKELGKYEKTIKKLIHLYSDGNFVTGEERFYSIKNASEQLGYKTPYNVRLMMTSGELEYVHKGHRKFIPEREIQRVKLEREMERVKNEIKGETKTVGVKGADIGKKDVVTKDYLQKQLKKERGRIKRTKQGVDGRRMVTKKYLKNQLAKVKSKQPSTDRKKIVTKDYLEEQLEKQKEKLGLIIESVDIKYEGRIKKLIDGLKLAGDFVSTKQFELFKEDFYSNLKDVIEDVIRERDYYSIKEAATALGYKNTSPLHWMKNKGKIEYKKWKGRVLIPREEVGRLTLDRVKKEMSKYKEKAGSELSSQIPGGSIMKKISGLKRQINHMENQIYSSGLTGVKKKNYESLLKKLGEMEENLFESESEKDRLTVRLNQTERYMSLVFKNLEKFNEHFSLRALKKEHGKYQGKFLDIGKDKFHWVRESVNYISHSLGPGGRREIEDSVFDMLGENPCELEYKLLQGFGNVIKFFDYHNLKGKNEIASLFSGIKILGEDSFELYSMLSPFIDINSKCRDNEAKKMKKKIKNLEERWRDLLGNSDEYKEIFRRKRRIVHDNV